MNRLTKEGARPLPSERANEECSPLGEDLNGASAIEQVWADRRAVAKKKLKAKLAAILADDLVGLRCAYELARSGKTASLQSYYGLSHSINKERDDGLGLVAMADDERFERLTAEHENSGTGATEPEQWKQKVTAITEKDILDLADWRGYGVERVRAIIAAGLIGKHNGAWAFPVRDDQGKFVGVHELISRQNKAWIYDPKGIGAWPLIHGTLVDADIAFVLESSWDWLAFLLITGAIDNPAHPVICTRGASNVAKLKKLWNPAINVIAIPQNDDAGQKWLGDIRKLGVQTLRTVKVPDPIHDLNDWLKADLTREKLREAIEHASFVGKESNQSQNAQARGERDGEEPKVYVEVLKPSEIKAYEPPPGTVLVGTNHIVRGSAFVIAGPPGVGKSRATVALGEAGATLYEWFGLSVHCNFRTLIVQSENGRYRLKQEFALLDEAVLDPYLRITPPPPFGLCFGKAEFRDQLKAQMEIFTPDVVLLDPWNAVSRDDKQKDYLESVDLVRDVVPASEHGPALGIVAHTRKPQPGERANGRALLNLIAGSYVLTSVPRCVWVLQSASDDVAENRVVITCCKNNDGELGARSVWVRDNGLWTRVSEFDWDEWDNPTPPSKRDKAITAEQMAAVFNGGSLTRKEAVDKLKALTGKKQATCYNATGADSPFEQLYFDKKTKLLSWMK